MDLKMPKKMPAAATMAKALGWFSIGLGLAELVAPRAVARACGMSGRETGVMRAYGAREVAAGVGLLKSMDPSPWLWARVAGDVLDIATVGYKARGRGENVKMGVALAMLAGVAAVDVLAARQMRVEQTRKPARDYSDRSGFSKPASQMRGVARDRAQEKPSSTPTRQQQHGSGPSASVH
jgi:hypothetical protein